MSLQKIFPVTRKEGEVTANIPEAQLISKDFRCRVKVNQEVNKTKGKAFLVDSLTLGNKTAISTILQQDTKGAWVAFDTVHPSSEKIQKSFDVRNKTDEDRTLFLVPFFMILGVLVLMEAYLIKKSAIDKVPIILTRDQWTNLILASGMVLIGMAFITYYLFQQKFHYSLFSSYKRETTRTFTFYLENKLQSRTALVYSGRFYVAENTPDSELFGYGPDEIEGGLTNADGEFFISALYSLRAQHHAILEEKAAISSEIREQQQLIAADLGTAEEQEDKETIREKIKDLEEMKKDHYLELDKLLEQIGKDIDELYKNYYEVLKEKISENIDEQRAQEIINSNETISALRNDLAIKTVQSIRAQRNIGALYENSVEGAMDFNDRLYHGMAELDLSKIQLQVQSQEHGNGKGHGSNPGSDVDWTPILETMVKFGLMGAFVYMVVWGMGQIVNIMSQVSPTMVVIGILAFLLAIAMLSRLANKISAYTSAADYTVKER